MILKILRLTLHSDAPMRGDTPHAAGFFGHRNSSYQISIQLKSYHNEDTELQSSAPKRG